MSSSNFKGTYFSQDIALNEELFQKSDYTADSTTTNKVLSDLITLTAGTGVKILDFNIKSFKIQCVAYDPSATLDQLTVTTSATSYGKFILECYILYQYTATGSDPVILEYNGNIEVPIVPVETTSFTGITMSLMKYFGKYLYIEPVDQTIFGDTFSALVSPVTTLSFTITFNNKMPSDPMPPTTPVFCSFDQSSLTVTLMCVGFVNNFTTSSKTIDMKYVAPSYNYNSVIEFTPATNSSTAGKLDTIINLSITEIKVKLEGGTEPTTTSDGTKNITGINITFNYKGYDSEMNALQGTATSTNNSITSTAIDVKYNVNGYILKPSSNIVINNLSGANVLDNTCSIEFVSSALIPVYTTDTANVYSINGEAIHSYTDANTTAVQLVQNKFNKSLSISDSTTSHNPFITFSSGFDTLFSSMFPSKSFVVKFNSDAGFTIPYVKNGVLTTKYVRISDLSAAIDRIEVEGVGSNSGGGGGGGEDVPDLADRLHALEVTLAKYNVSELKDASAGTTAAHLYEIKEQYKTV